jgi:hypothetical protein
MAAKMPRRSHALFLVIDGRVENPEFVVHDLESYREELWKWKRKAVRVDGRHVEFWCKHDASFYRFNPNAV